MKFYGAKNVEIAEGITAIDVEPELPTPTVSQEGQIVFLENVGLHVYHDGQWHPAMVLGSPPPEFFSFGGEVWNMNEVGRQQFVEAVLFCLLHGGDVSDPMLFETATGEKKFMTALAVMDLYKAYLQQRIAARS